MVPMSVKVGPDMHQRLQAEAARRRGKNAGMSLSDLVRELLAEALDRHEPRAKTGT
jgi:Arc/MetJ-type ribon-helix-helix transcriptional regulator